MKTVLVTCVGSGVGQSVIDSLNIKREFKIVGCDGNPNVYAHSFCDEFYVVPGLYTAGYVDYILNLAIDKEVDIVVPGHDHELVLFAEAYNTFKSHGVEVLVSDSQLISVSRDKQIWHDFFIPFGCKIVPTLSVEQFLENPDTSILPAIVKPSGGSASQGISIINDLTELEGLNPKDIIQPYLFPEESDKNYVNIFNAVKKGKFLQMSEISIQLIFDNQSKFSGIFISKNVLKNGVPVHVDPIDPEEFGYTDEILKFVPILEKNAVRGPVNIQGRITPEGLYFFEMNMRFTGITGNRALLGFNEVDFLVRNFLGLPQGDLKNYAFNKIGVRQVACTTIERQNDSIQQDTLTVLGGGSNIGRSFISSVSGEYKWINVVVRSASLARYQAYFKTFDNVRLIDENDVTLQQVLCQSDALVNFVSALAFQDDQTKYDAIRFIQRLIIKISKANINKIINISSQSVYPQGLNVQKSEDHEVNYANSYSFQKIMMEDMFSMVKELRPWSKVVSLRLTRVIAPSIPQQAGFFGKMIQSVQMGETISISNPMNNTNLIHIDDVISAVKFVLAKMGERRFPEVLNVGGENITMKEFAEKVLKSVTGTGKITFEDTADVENSSTINDSKLRQLGWTNHYGIQDIIQQFI